MKEMLKELDARYVKKSELKQEVSDIVGDKFMTKEDYHEILGKMNAMEIELSKNTDLLMNIYSTSERTQQIQIKQKIETDLIKEDIKKASQSWIIKQWNSVPRVARWLIAVLSVYVIAAVLSMFIGPVATEFMHENGAFVAIVTGSVSFFLSGKEGK